MMVKDFLLSLNPEQLYSVYFDMYYKNNEISLAEAKNNGYDLTTCVYNSLKHFLEQIKNIDVTSSPNKRLIVSEYVDTTILDNWDVAKCSTMDAYYIKLTDITDMGQLQHITTHDDLAAKCFWQAYGIMMTSWEDLLGFEVAYIPKNQYAAASCILFEMTFWGYDKELKDAKIKTVIADLERAEKEIEAGSYLEYNDEDFRRKFNLPTSTPEQKEQEQKLYREIYVENYNISVDIYNKLQSNGLFQKHTPN